MKNIPLNPPSKGEWLCYVLGVRICTVRKVVYLGETCQQREALRTFPL